MDHGQKSFCNIYNYVIRTQGPNTIENVCTNEKKATDGVGIRYC
jgi:hypothetical protein